MLSASERRVLQAFRAFRVSPGQMLCFDGANLKRLRSALQQLTDKNYLVKEQFKGGYSMTAAGFQAMKAIST